MSDLVERLRAMALDIVSDLAWCDEAADRIERLEEWITYYATCPCCEQKRNCHEECTFITDAPDYHERMQQARNVLWENHD